MGTSGKRVPCPVCEASVVAGAKTFPFCSARCKAVDLGNWLDERYCLEAEITQEDGSESLH